MRDSLKLEGRLEGLTQVRTISTLLVPLFKYLGLVSYIRFGYIKIGRTRVLAKSSGLEGFYDYGPSARVASTPESVSAYRVSTPDRR